jgi:hypothetical protein
MIKTGNAVENRVLGRSVLFQEFVDTLIVQLQLDFGQWIRIGGYPITEADVGIAYTE